ncbi:hypothetical protein DPMN_129758 [Dreissena polymorpha]|uniref:Uncharacterized protein n=1 Tax=Dreissena polymorpha TaxID=45954 RepID=A0A9D4H3D8_DREPO|nr:hypothetical protein DPMN_129758 [Dreissena polymorpha]
MSSHLILARDLVWPSTSFLQASWFWASLSSCPHVLSICFESLSRARCQVFLWRPLYGVPGEILPCRIGHRLPKDVIVRCRKRCGPTSFFIRFSIIRLNTFRRMENSVIPP